MFLFVLNTNYWGSPKKCFFLFLTKRNNDCHTNVKFCITINYFHKANKFIQQRYRWDKGKLKDARAVLMELTLWHMPHGIDLHTTPKNSYNYYLLYGQSSPAKFALAGLTNFYCCKRLLGRNNTETISAPHERCQHLFKGALLLPTA